MKALSRSEAAAFLQAGDRFVILTHRRPDGDTLGSAAALCRGLRQLGKTAHVLENPGTTPMYAPLLQDLTCETVAEGDCLVCVDVAAQDMLPAAFLPLADRLRLRIDHHRGDKHFTPLELVEPTTASCGQIIYHLLTLLGVSLDIPMANAIYTAISTDTGCFRYANTQSDTFAVAAACAKVSSDLTTINRTLFETVTLARLRLQGWIVENAQFLQSGKIIVCALPKEIEEQFGVTEDDMDNISGFPRSIAGVELSAMLRHQPDGKVKLSMRAVPELDASAICGKFGGGGHRGAAGATLDMPMDQAVQTVIAALPEL